MELTPRRNFRLKGIWGLYLFSYIYIAVHDPACGSCDTALDDMVAIDLDVHGSHAAGMTEAGRWTRLLSALQAHLRSFPGEAAAAPVPIETVIGYALWSDPTETARTQISIVSAGVRFPSMSL